MALTEEQFQRDLQARYPEIWAVLNKPGVYQVVRQAIEENWPLNRLQVALEGTEYFKTTPDTTRQWDILLATDPATAKQRGDDFTNRVLAIAQQYGITLTPVQQWDIVTSGLQQGADDAWIKHSLLFGAAFSGIDSSGGTGVIAGTAQSVKQLASQYAVPISDEAARKWALGMADGVVTQDGLTAYMIEQAKSMFPGLAAALDRGITVRQYADPYLQIAGQNLGVDPNSLDLSDQKWATALNQVDAFTGERRSMNLEEWTRTIRTDPRYGYSLSQPGREAGSQLVEALGQKLGVVG